MSTLFQTSDNQCQVTFESGKASYSCPGGFAIAVDNAVKASKPLNQVNGGGGVSHTNLYKHGSVFLSVSEDPDRIGVMLADPKTGFQASSWRNANDPAGTWSHQVWQRDSDGKPVKQTF